MKEKKYLKKLISLSFLCFVLFGNVGTAIARDESGLGSIAANLFSAEMNLHDIIRAIAITAGVGLILGAVMKYVRYRSNPMEAHLSMVFTNLVIGAVLILLAFIPLPV